MLMPYQVTLVPNFLVSKWLNLLDTNWAIWLPGIFSPYAVFLLTKVRFDDFILSQTFAP